MVSRLSPDGRLSLIAGGEEDASPLTGEPATAATSTQDYQRSVGKICPKARQCLPDNKNTHLLRLPNQINIHLLDRQKCEHNNLGHTKGMWN